MGLRSPRMPGFSPIVIWMRRWVYSIVCPSCFTIHGPGVTSSTTSRPCCANPYTADWLVMKMSTMPIVYLLIRLCEGSPGKKIDEEECRQRQHDGSIRDPDAVR